MWFRPFDKRSCALKCALSLFRAQYGEQNALIISRCDYNLFYVILNSALFARLSL